MCTITRAAATFSCRHSGFFVARCGIYLQNVASATFHAGPATTTMSSAMFHVPDIEFRVSGGADIAPFVATNHLSLIDIKDERTALFGSTQSHKDE
jgi:hypothetical protein